jgi:hypothetical protein
MTLIKVDDEFSTESVFASQFTFPGMLLMTNSPGRRNLYLQ